MSPLGNFPSTDPLSLLVGYKSPAVEPDLSPTVKVFTPSPTVLKKVFLTILTSIAIFVFS